MNARKEDELDEVIGKLTAAALQISPKDDQIIADHIRDSVALLLQYRHKIRNRGADEQSTPDQMKECDGCGRKMPDLRCPECRNA